MKITAAAIKIGQRVWTGKRHADIMRDIRAEMEQGGYECPRITQEMQGFVDEAGNFWNRFQAGALAFRAGQTPTRKQTLLSEHLW